MEELLVFSGEHRGTLGSSPRWGQCRPPPAPLLPPSSGWFEVVWTAQVPLESWTLEVQGILWRWSSRPLTRNMMTRPSTAPSTGQWDSSRATSPSSILADRWVPAFIAVLEVCLDLRPLFKGLSMKLHRLGMFDQWRLSQSCNNTIFLTEKKPAACWHPEWHPCPLLIGNSLLITQSS